MVSRPREVCTQLQMVWWKQKELNNGDVARAEQRSVRTHSLPLQWDKVSTSCLLDPERSASPSQKKRQGSFLRSHFKILCFLHGDPVQRSQLHGNRKGKAAVLASSLSRSRLRLGLGQRWRLRQVGFRSDGRKRMRQMRNKISNPTEDASNIPKQTFKTKPTCCGSCDFWPGDRRPGQPSATAPPPAPRRRPHGPAGGHSSPGGPGWSPAPPASDREDTSLVGPGTPR